MARTSLKERMLFLAPLVLQTAIWIPTRIILFVFLRFSVRGLEHVRSLKGSVVFAANHGSEWDPVLIPAALPFLSPLMPMFYTSRERSFYGKKGIQAFLYGGLFFKIWGAYPVKVGMRNYGRSLKTHIRILEEGHGSICIFPEGGKTKDGRLHTERAKGGVSFLAHRAGVPVVPVAISGIFNMKKKDFFLRRRKVVVTFASPLFPSEFSPAGYMNPEECKKAARKIMEEVKKNVSDV